MEEKQSKTPLISVIMPIYNEEEYIEDCIRSILAQTEGNFEFIIIDDCSTDRTVEIIENLIETTGDDRIVLVKGEVNRGLTKNLNIALGMAKGKYIARMDGDDIAVDKRFETQVKYLENHPDIILISCNTNTFGDQSLVSDYVAPPEVLKCRMLIRPVMGHPGFMFRRELFEKYGITYDEHFISAQDYDIAARVAQTLKIGVAPEVLVRYRSHKGQVSQAGLGKQFKFADEVRVRLLGMLGISLDEQSMEVFHKWVLEQPATIDEYRQNAKLTQNIITANKTSAHLYDEHVLKKVLWQQYFRWMFRAGNSKYVFNICGLNVIQYCRAVGCAVELVKSKFRRRKIDRM